MLDRALEARTHYVRLADRAARLYSPLVHAAALATMLGWVAFGTNWHDAVITAIAVLIITCPCALGLAIPAGAYGIGRRKLRGHLNRRDANRARYADGGRFFRLRGTAADGRLSTTGLRQHGSALLPI